MRRIACVVVTGGVVVLLGCDATSPVTSFGASATSLTASIAFESNREGSPSIYLANGDGTGVTRLVPGMAPAWSRDGSRIAYYSDGQMGTPDVYVIDPDGSHERYLVSGQDPVWGPGDREIAYRGNGGIFAIAADGSTPPRMLIPDDLALPRPEGWSDADHDPGWDESPVWSPNGDQIAFLRVDPINWDWGADRNMYVINVDGSNLRLLGRSCKIPPPGTGSLPCPVTSLAWSPSGSSLALSTYDIDTETGALDPALGLVAANFDPNSGDQMDVLYHGIENYLGHPQWSADGSAIIFDAHPDPASGLRILALSLASRAIKQLIPEAAPPALATYQDEHAVWRPGR